MADAAALIRESLLDITSLILQLHEKYVKGIGHESLIIGLMTFIEDTLLADFVSIVDAERFRQLVSKRNAHTLNQEQFYEWLKFVAEFVYEDSDDPRKSLHSLLVNHIIPVAKADTMLHPVSSKWLPLSKLASHIMKYFDFVAFWYCSLTSVNLDMHCRWTPLVNYWQLTQQYHKSISVSKVVESFANLGFSPTLFSDSDFKELLWNYFDSTTMASNSRVVNFHSFLVIIHYVCLKMTMSPIQSLGLGDSLQSRVTVLLTIVASKLLSARLQAFYEFDLSLYPSFGLADNSRLVGISVDSLLWLLRQSGITQLDSVSIPWLFDELCSEGISSFSQCLYLQTPKIPLVLVRIVESCTKISCVEFMSLTGIDEVDRSSLYLASSCAAILFASPLRLPTPLTSLYSVTNIERVRKLLDSRRLFQVYWACAAIAQRDSPLDENVGKPIGVTVLSFCILCEEKNLIPTTISQELVLTTSEYVLGAAFPYQEVSMGDFMELIYVLAQICFENMSIVVTSEGEIEVIETVQPVEEIIKTSVLDMKEQSVLKADLLVECLISVDSEEVMRAQGTSNALPEATHAGASEQPPKLTGMDAQSTVPTIAVAATAGIVAENPRPNSSSGQILDVLILLMNFPQNSFELNPWDIFQLLLVKTSPRQHANIHPATVVDADSGDCLSGIFEEFCNIYHVSTQKLSSFFATFYLEPDSNAEFLMKPQVKRALRDPSLIALVQDDVIRLLYANSDIIRWEFCRLTTHHRNIDPFTTNLDVPIPTYELLRNRPDDVLVRGEALLHWATEGIAWLCEVQQQSTTKTEEGALWSWRSLPSALILAIIKAVLRDSAILSYISLMSNVPVEEDITFTFAGFCQFIVRLWTINFFHSIDELTNPNHNYISKSTRDSQELNCPPAYHESLRLLLGFIAQKLANIQRHLKIRLLYPIVGIDSSYIHSAVDSNGNLSAGSMLDMEYDNIIDATHLLDMLAEVYNQRYPVVEHLGPYSYLPPRPPHRIWDAPRVSEYLKMIGISHYFGSCIYGWLGYGDFFNRLSDSTTPMPLASDTHGVQPFPVKLSSSNIFDIIQGACERVAPSCSAATISYIHGMSTMEFAMCQVVIPMAVGTTDRILHGNAASSTQGPTGTGASKTLEDILRYGGDRVMASLQANAHFIDTIYDVLCVANLETSDELPLPAACRYLACNGILRSGQIALQAKRSLHPRLRHADNKLGNNPGAPVPRSSNCPLAVSRVEFEELLLRCALSAWELTGAIRFADHESTPIESIIDVPAFLKSVVQTNNNQEEFIITMLRSMDNSSHESLLLSKIDPATGFLIDEHDPVTRDASIQQTIKTAERFVKEVIASLHTPTSHSNRIVSSWGTDFLSAYLVVLKEIIRVGSQSAAGDANQSHMSVQSEADQSVLDPIAPIVPTDAAQIQMQTHYSHWPNLGRCYGVHITSSAQTTDAAVNSFEPAQIPSVQPMSYGVTIFVQRPLNLTGPNAALVAPPSPDNVIVDHVYSHVVVDPSLPPGEFDLTNSAYFFSPNKSALIDDGVIGQRHASATPLKPIEPEATVTYSPSFNPAPLHSSSPKAKIRNFSDNDDHRRQALWPIYATYCSCGDSTSPGKLSGPNLFSLLSKLGILSDDTLLSDIGILIHQIVAHAHAQTSLDATNVYVDNIGESPSLSYEEFMVFLCAYAQLRFEGVVAAVPLPFLQEHQLPNTGRLSLSSSRVLNSEGAINFPVSTQRRSVASQQWFRLWEEHMNYSTSFKTLLEEHVLPILKKNPLLAFPEDARHRDRYGIIFSLEVLLAVEGAEQALKAIFTRHLGRNQQTSNRLGGNSHGEFEVESILNALHRINLLPQVITENQARQLVNDVLPAVASSSSQRNRNASPTKRKGNSKSNDHSESSRRHRLLFPQWEWILCVVAYEAVDIAVRESRTYTDAQKIPALVADIVTQISKAMRSI